MPTTTCDHLVHPEHWPEMRSDLVESNVAARCVNTSRPLTHSLDYGKEGLAMNATRICSLEDCDNKHRGLGYCRRHYERFKSTGDPRGLRRPNQLEAFWSKVEKGPECWMWTGTRNGNGYGMLWDQKRRTMRNAHRLGYELIVGPVADGLEVDHLCHNRLCVNPEHLRTVTRKQNMENTRSAGRGRSGVRGVSYSHGKWAAEVGHNGKSFWLGEYDTIAEAEAVVIAKRLELHTHGDMDLRGQDV